MLNKNIELIPYKELPIVIYTKLEHPHWVDSKSIEKKKNEQCSRKKWKAVNF